MSFNIRHEIDNNLKASLIIECQNCRRIHKKQMKDISVNTKFTCQCGNCLMFKDDNLRKIQAELDKLKKQLDIPLKITFKM